MPWMDGAGVPYGRVALLAGQVGSGKSAKSFELQLAHTAERAISDPRTLFGTVESAWNGVVEVRPLWART